MDSFLVLLLVGFAIGTVGTLIGAGGGFILVPLLLLTHTNMEPNIITAISIAVVAVNAISGSFAYAKSKRIDYKAGIIFGLFTIPGSIASVFLTKYIPINLFNWIFGFILVGLAIYLFIKNKKIMPARIIPLNRKAVVTHTLKDNHNMVFSYSYQPIYGIIISIIVGFISPLLGIGGGIIHVPAMVQWLHFPVYIATATSHFILAIMATVSVIVHIFQGSYHEPYVLHMVIALCLGVIPGAQLGAYISHKIQTHIIIKMLAVCLMIVGLRILL